MRKSRDCYAEYIWLDGATPTQKIRSKTRVLPAGSQSRIEDFPVWGFDGSSTSQAEGDSSDCALKPVFFCNDPLRGEGHYIVLCEVLTPDLEPHPTNQRAHLRRIIELTKMARPLIGFEQEYTFFTDRNPLGWPEDGYPAPQGPFYCGVGARRVYGREIVEKHLNVCSSADLAIYGINAEVMPGQWEFQIGYRGRDHEEADPLTMSDHLWVARYFLERIAEDYGVAVSFENKPVKGDWNGAGMHTNFSTEPMRDRSSGRKTIEQAIKHLSQRHDEHIKSYGFGLSDRLTGLHETCRIDQFKSGVSDRGASIRIPMSTEQNGYGYLEDRRPGANADPYLVSTRLVETVCQLPFNGQEPASMIAGRKVASHAPI